jgi:hypothetical protein
VRPSAKIAGGPDNSRVLPVKRESNSAVGPFLHVIGPFVPDADVAGAVLTFGDLAFEVTEGEVVILHPDGKALHTGVFGNPFGYSPALVYPVFFQAEIEVVRSSMVLLDYESRHFHRFLITGDVPLAFRLSGLLYAEGHRVAIHLLAVPVLWSFDSARKLPTFEICFQCSRKLP